jgi:hypothetical protein
MHIVKRSDIITKLEDVRRTPTLHEGRKVRSSTGTVISPLVPVDGVELMRGCVATVAALRQGPSSANSSHDQPTSIELLRQLEACVRELLDISAKGHQ